MSYVGTFTADTDGSATDTLVCGAFTTSGTNRHVDVAVCIATSSATTVSSVSRGSETYAEQRADLNPTGSSLVRGSFHMSTTEPQTASAAMTVVISASRSFWGFQGIVADGVDQTTRLRGGVVTLNPDGDGAVSELAYSSAVGDLVVSAILGNSGTPSSAVVGDGTLRGTWAAPTDGWGAIATAPGASTVTLDWDGTPFRFVHYAASHPPPSDVAPTVTVPTGYLATNNLGARTISQMRSPTPDNISVAEGTSPITLVTLTCTLGKGTMTMTASGSSAVSGNGTNAISIIGGSETDINNTLATFAFTGLEPTRENVTVAILATDGTLNDTANLVLFNHRTSLTIVADSYADLVAMIQTAKMILPQGSTSGQVEIAAEDDDMLPDTQIITLNLTTAATGFGINLVLRRRRKKKSGN